MRFCLLMIAICGQLAGAVFHHVPQELRGAVEAVEALPEAQELLRQVEREGRVRLRSGRLEAFNAMWESGGRTITVNNRWKRTEGSLIVSIVFELCNAARNQDFRKLWRQAAWNEISKEAFVRAVERIEFESLGRAAVILSAGRQQGLFPRDARQWAPSSFETYLRAQKAAGHSAFIARNYKRVQGTARA